LDRPTLDAAPAVGPIMSGNTIRPSIPARDHLTPFSTYVGGPIASFIVARLNDWLCQSRMI
jgi:hypothetical protein